MALQLTSVLHRLRCTTTQLAAQATVLLAPGAARRPALDLPDDVPRHAAARARLALPPPVRERFDLLVGRGEVPAEVLGRALVAGRTLAAVEGLAAAWPRSAAGRAAVSDPVASLGAAGTQRSGVTCGPASLTMLAAAGDPFLAWWLATGERVGPVPELTDAGAEALDRLGAVGADARFAALHRVVHVRATRGALGGLDWPRAWGTPPWALARAARFGDVRYRAVVADDTDPAHQESLLVLVRDAVGRGVPVPLYSGGDTSQGVAAAVPRHVTLAVRADDAALDVYDPASGRTHAVAWEALATGDAGRALGGWPHLVWVVLPRESSY